MRGLNLDQLRALETVVELASFTGAARRLNLSQSAISVQIRELEERCGVRLVERLGKKAYATGAGSEVLDHARRIFREADAIATAMRRYRDGWVGRVHIGAALTALMYLLPPVLKKLHNEHPGIELMVNNATTAGMVEAVLRNELDVAVVTLPIVESRLEIIALHIDDMVAILPASMRDVPDKITPEFAANQFLVLEFGGVSSLIHAWLSAGRAVPQSSMVLSAIEAVKIVVSAGMGISIVPAMAVAQTADDILVRPLSPPLSRTLGLVHHPHKPNDPAFRIVREALLALTNVPRSERAAE